MRKKKELTETEKRDLAMKYEVAEELGLLEKVERCGCTLNIDIIAKAVIATLLYI